MTLLDGFAITGYRSIYGGLQIVGPLGKVNLLAGQNNAGKSNILRFAHERIGHRDWSNPDELDQPLVENPGRYEFALACTIDDAYFDQVTSNLQAQASPMVVRDELHTLFGAKEFHLTTDDDLLWFRYEGIVAKRGSNRNPTPNICESFISMLATSTHSDFRTASAGISGQYSSTLDNIRRIVSRFSPHSSLPPVRIIEAFRRITPGEGTQDESVYATGQGLIADLQKLQQPSITRQSDKARFEAINAFLQNVLEDPTARLDIPYDATVIHVERGGLTLPLEHLGTGVHQVVILASAATLIEKSLVCIEEPEVHLHPLLQRKLVRYLAENTDNQYLISTHSAQILDHERANVFHVQNTDRGTEVQRAGTPQKVSQLCADLGYRPSDLLQANCVIWVEGPSDRIYLRHWIQLVAPSLIEGIHYSIMFYGGRLLNHLSAMDPEVSDFISLRRLNRNIAILIDSDKQSSRARINETKKRVCSEFEGFGESGLAWVTDGYTIENYVPLQLLIDAVAAVHPSAKLIYNGEKWSNPFKTTEIKMHIDKVKIAQDVCRNWLAEDLDQRDLSQRVQQIVQFVRRANGEIGAAALSKEVGRVGRREN